MDGRILRCTTRRVNSEEKKQTGKKKKARGRIYRKKHGRLYKQRLRSLVNRMEGEEESFVANVQSDSTTKNFKLNHERY